MVDEGGTFSGTIITHYNLIDIASLNVDHPALFAAAAGEIRPNRISTLDMGQA